MCVLSQSDSSCSTQYLYFFQLTVAIEMLGQLQSHLSSKVEQEKAQVLDIQRLESANRELELTVQELNRQINDLRENNKIQKLLAAKAVEEKVTTVRKLRSARRMIRDLLDERNVVKSFFFFRSR
jgi:vacuolar-type H+-ATPase subunit I/STV1